MYELTEADRIWNRACGPDRLRTLSGDRALADLLYAHGLVMNGGVFHGIECMTTDELSKAKAGYRYFGMGDVASLLDRARGIVDTANDLGSHEHQLDSEYMRLIPSDSFLSNRFEEQLKASPSDFAPLQ